MNTQDSLSLTYSMIANLKSLYRQNINSIRKIKNLLFGKSNLIIKFGRERNSEEDMEEERKEENKA